MLPRYQAAPSARGSLLAPHQLSGSQPQPLPGPEGMQHFGFEITGIQDEDMHLEDVPCSEVVPGQLILR